MRKISPISLSRLATNGLMIALFFVLSLFSVQLGGIKITFDSLPIVIVAVLFGPVDAFVVGLLGAFLEQIIHFGITVTTIAWILPPACRGLIIGLALRLLPRSERLWIYYSVCVAAALVTSTLNTLAYYIDSKLFGYYNYALIFGVYYLRLASGALTGIITATIAKPILAALKKTGFLERGHHEYQ